MTANSSPNLSSVRNTTLKHNMTKPLLVLASASAMTFCSSSAAFAKCSFNSWKSYQGTELLRHTTEDAYLFVTDHMRIDADGAPNAYGPNDIGLDDVRNAGYPNKSWWRSVLVPDPEDNQKAYVKKSGDFAGYYVSRTALSDSNLKALQPGKYVDATAVPYMVFPGSFAKLNGTGRLGDIGVAIHLDTGLMSPFVVADIGPSKAKLGEVSIALAEKLGGKDVNPRNGAGQPSGSIAYVVFRYSSDESAARRWPISAKDLKQRGQDFLKTVGGKTSITSCKN